MNASDSEYTFVIERAGIEPLTSIKLIVTLPEDEDDSTTESHLSWIEDFIRVQQDDIVSVEGDPLGLRYQATIVRQDVEWNEYEMENA